MEVRSSEKSMDSGRGSVMSGVEEVESVIASEDEDNFTQ